MKLICINLTDQIDPYVDIPLTDQSPQQSSPTCNTFTITQASPLSTMKNHTKERNEQKKHGGVKEKSTGTSLKRKKIAQGHFLYNFKLLGAQTITLVHQASTSSQRR